MRWYKSPKGLQNLLWILFGCFVIVPVLWVFLRAFESTLPYETTNFFVWLTRYLSLDQYRQVLFWDLEYWVSYWNTIFLTLPTLAAALLLSSMAAFGLTVVGKKLRNGILFLFAMLSLLPSQVLLVPQLILLSGAEMTGTRLGVILVGSFSPWYVFFLHRLCAGVAPETYEAARMEGAGERTIFIRVALPQMKLGILIFAVVISSQLWGMVEEPLVYMQDPMKYPMSVYFHETGLKVPYAGVAVFALPVVLLFAGCVRSVVKGE